MFAGNTSFFAGPAVATGASCAARNGTVDAARFFGALGIVWFHEHAPFAWLGYAALPMFMAFVLYFALATSDRPANERRRGTRLLLPWLGWSAIYGVAKIADAVANGEPVAAEFAPWMLLAGPKIHLWFLPFAFVAGWGLIALLPTIRRHCGFPQLWGLFVAGQVGMFYIVSEIDVAWPMRQWLFVGPACLLGLMLYIAAGDRNRLLAVLAGSTLACWLATSFGWPHGAIQTLIATAVCVAALAIPLRASALTEQMAAISLGIYLVHPLVHSLLMRLPGAAPGTLGFAVSVAAVSVAAAIVMKQVPGVRRIV